MNALTQPPPPKPIVKFKDTFLSNFWLSPIILNGLPYLTAEHAFQAQKSLELIDRARIADCATPAEAKRAGQQMTLRPDWEQYRKRAMLNAVMAKFTQNPALAALLAATGAAPLVEGNMWHDQFWGSCCCQRPKCQDPGLNYLGRILEAVRFIIRED